MLLQMDLNSQHDLLDSQVLVSICSPGTMVLQLPRLPSGHLIIQTLTNARKDPFVSEQ